MLLRGVEVRRLALARVRDDADRLVRPLPLAAREARALVDLASAVREAPAVGDAHAAVDEVRAAVVVGEMMIARDDFISERNLNTAGLEAPSSLQEHTLDKNLRPLSCFVCGASVLRCHVLVYF